MQNRNKYFKEIARCIRVVEMMPKVQEMAAPEEPSCGTALAPGDPVGVRRTQFVSTSIYFGLTSETEQAEYNITQQQHLI